MLMAYWLQWPDLFGIPEMPVEVTRSICFLITLYVPNCLEDIKVWFSQIFIHGAYIYHLENDCWWPRPSLPGKVRKPRVRCAWNCRLQLSGGNFVQAGKSGRYFEDDLKCIFLIYTVQSIGHPHLGRAFCMARIWPQVPSHQEEIMGYH